MGVSTFIEWYNRNVLGFGSYTFKCCECGKKIELSGKTMTSITDEAERLGWDYDGGEREWCPVHKHLNVN